MLSSLLRFFRCCPIKTRNLYSYIVVIVTVLVLNLAVDEVAALPSGFEDEGVVSMNGVVDVAFVGTMMLGVTKPGVVYVYDLADPDAKIQLAVDLTTRICDNGERGLGQVTAHPNFEENRWIYLFYTYNRGSTECAKDADNGPVNRCSRWVMNDDWTVDEGSELVLFQTSVLLDQIHNGGDMEFGVDGMLYVTMGDAGARVLQYAQKRNNLFGTIVRVTESGDIPADNPFLGEGTARCNEAGRVDEGIICQEIFAYGLRNPFRFTMDTHSTDKVRFLISDVGGRSWEEIDEGGTDFAGVNYGYPLREGPCRYDSKDNCPMGDPDDGFMDPLHFYPHDSEEEACVVGVAIPPAGLAWPSPYNDPTSFYYVDFVWGLIFHATEVPDQFCSSCSPPRSGYRNETFHEWPAPIGLKFGPYVDHSNNNEVATSLALYYTFRQGSIWVRRIVYKGGNNWSPVVAFAFDKAIVPMSGVITFDATSTSDPNHPLEELSFTWDFGDGSTKTGMVVSHEYTDVGLYIVTLDVVDPDGATGRASNEVTVGAPPNVEILEPKDGTTFAVGDVLTLSGVGTDHYGKKLDELTQLSWEVKQHHQNHFHPFLDEGTFGNHFNISEAPAPEDFFAAGNSYLEILLTGTDTDGIKSTVSRNIMPSTVEVDFDTEPSGLKLSLDEELVKTPKRVLSWENHSLRIKAFDQTENNQEYVFVEWKNGVADKREDEIIMPARLADVVPLYVAKFRLASTDIPTTAPATTAPVSNPPTVATIVATFPPFQSPKNASSDPLITDDSRSTESNDVVLLGGTSTSESNQAYAVGLVGVMYFSLFWL